uniref:Chaperonin GroEL n=1 Tax=uncultured virus TaxID=340016 RepID=A0A240F7C0_9VIRU|nr:chaperonin GroEL [uncultured virus]
MEKTFTSFGTDLKDRLLSGVKQLNEAVSSTLGPAGRTVMIKRSGGRATKITKDGVTVAKNFKELEDQVESIGVELVKNVSIKSGNEVGDGTTTSCVLATSILEEGIKQIKDGSNAVEIKKGIDEAVSTVISKLKEMSTEITDDAQIKEVATISANNDEECGELILQALDKVGRDGIVTIEESKTGETYLEIVEGMEMVRGYLSPYFVTDNNTMSAILNDPLIFIYDGVITRGQELVNVLQIANTENRPLLIVAENVGGEALATLIVNKMRGIVNVCAIKAPDFGDRRTMALEDLATVTGGQVISKAKGHKLEKMVPGLIQPMLGGTRTVTVTKEKTTIVDGKGDSDKIEEKAQEIKELIENANSTFEKEKLQERLGKLVGGVSIINVGGNSEVEMKEKKDRMVDALYASLAAIDDGIVIGGGTALLYAAGSIDIKGNDDQTIGRRIVKKAIVEPFTKILTNAGHDINDVRYAASKLIDSGNDLWTGLNYKDLTTLDFKKAGIIDPLKVVKTALQNASSVAGTILTTDAAVIEERHKEGQSAHVNSEWDPNGFM